MDLIEIWRKTRSEKKAEHKKFIKSLRKVKNKELNEQANELHDAVFEEIDCLDCANCCTSIPPIINETDVRRAAKALSMKPADFKEEYVRIDEDQDMVMSTSPCPFLQEDHKCFIYESRPKACREYPHINNYEFLKNLKLHALNSYYCPAVFHVLERLQQK